MGQDWSFLLLLICCVDEKVKFNGQDTTLYIWPSFYHDILSLFRNTPSSEKVDELSETCCLRHTCLFHHIVLDNIKSKEKRKAHSYELHE
jgi:hypothetical protein